MLPQKTSWMPQTDKTLDTLHTEWARLRLYTGGNAFTNIEVLEMPPPGSGGKVDPVVKNVVLEMPPPGSR